MKVTNKTFIITGAGNGIGRELVLHMLGKGAKIAALDISKAALDELVKISGAKEDNLKTYTVDITDREAIEKVRGQIIADAGHVDGLINNAGIIQPFIKLNELGYRDIERVLSVNFWGCVYMTKTFLPDLLGRPVAHLVNTSSMGGFLPVPGQSVYGAAKAAVKLMTEGLVQELKNTNVKVSVVFPGAIGTNIMKNSGLTGAPDMVTSNKAAMVLSPQKAATLIVKGIEKDKARIFVGKDAKIMDLIYRFNALFAANLVGKQMEKMLKKQD